MTHESLNIRKRQKSDETPRGARPLVDKQKIGAKRRAEVNASSLLDGFDLKAHLLSDAFARGVVINYDQAHDMTEADRKVIVRSIVSWLLSKTEFPVHSHYLAMQSKICELFPTEDPTTYYIEPFAEGDQQKNAKGKLPQKVKNSKTWLRNHDALECNSRNKKSRREEEILDNTDELLTGEVVGAIEWLKRNKEPFEDVRQRWKVCQEVRLTELILNKKYSPHEYIERWFDVLTMPQAYQLVLDDYDFIHKYIKNYDMLEGTSNNLTINWEGVCKKLLTLASSSEFSKSKSVRRLETLYASSASNDVKDLLVLEILSEILKCPGPVKVGKKTYKPSVSESQDAFLLLVPVAGELKNAMKEKVKKNQEKGAAVQPYIIIVGTETNVDHSYVCVNKHLWQVSSVLQAVEVCFKTFFVLNADYPPEAHHLWLFIQHALFSFKLRRERSVSTVTVLVGKMSRLI